VKKHGLGRIVNSALLGAFARAIEAPALDTLIVTLGDEVPKLRDENIRMGAELDVARRIQLMVLPTDAELEGVPDLDIGSHVEPADEVGGDYFDLLYTPGGAKIGIGDVTGLPRLVAAMQAHGYGEALITKLCSENWLRVLDTTWGR
jgi:hypothetical protein